jgi:hypothetical protein
MNKKKLPNWYTQAPGYCSNSYGRNYCNRYLESSYDGYEHYVMRRNDFKDMFNGGIESYGTSTLKRFFPHDFDEEKRQERLGPSKLFPLSHPIALSLEPIEPFVPSEAVRICQKIVDASDDQIKALVFAKYDGFTEEQLERRWDPISSKKNELEDLNKDAQNFVEDPGDQLKAYTLDQVEGNESEEDDSELHGGEKAQWKIYKSEAQEFLNNYSNVVAKNEETYKKACNFYLDAQFSPWRLASLTYKVNTFPDFFDYCFCHFEVDADKKILQISFTFPDYKEEQIAIDVLKSGKVKYATEAAKRKLVKESLYSMIIWIGHVHAMQQKETSLEQIAINVEQSWHDPATGKPMSGIIASVFGAVDYFASLNLSQLDPTACMRDLKGIVTPSLETQSPIRPIFEMNTDDKRIVDSKDVDGTLVGGENLAMMPWEDFEHLVAQLFEWEFAKDGAEVKVTQASRDRGVDAILFDPDPIRGGKYVLQAKRYTLTVDVASVRDLYGTVMNEGANRGILITTSSYGPDSYEFAKDKPISLIDGPRLLEMLTKHGKDYKIDLKEARDLYGAEK